jgi:hypothetical protein
MESHEYYSIILFGQCHNFIFCEVPEVKLGYDELWATNTYIY